MDKGFFFENFCFTNEQRRSFLTYSRLLSSWQKNLNLVSSRSLEDQWARHFIDSAQIIEFIKPYKNYTGIIDIGSGAGFPGLVLSLLGCCPMYLIESNRHKVAFLKEVIGKTGSKAKVLNDRIENVKLPSFNIVISRAFSSINKLLSILELRGIYEVKCIFPKGKTYNQELDETKKIWDINLRTYKSITNSESRIVVVEAFKRV
ncbi:MAG: 16S rRNA (guanine(527)-N(7))-methyltransferase RsmG [Rhodospirillaceae bacterium]|nr:16S rRNA (guanine(527)-N(7))-methyltransferase RsmG [Rhodospirillaceae bacterium]|tara:strand:+ start:1237 stop:1848 length:612 start_codon:yes stop_codon:yes gene_type:complete